MEAGSVLAHRVRLLALASALGAAVACRADAQSPRLAGGGPVRSVLLLGIRAGDPRTIAVEVTGDSVFIRSGPGLIVPRRTGFWRVGIGEPTRDLPEYRGRALAKAGMDSLLPDKTVDSLSHAAAMAEQERESAADDSARAADNATAESSEAGAPRTNMQGEPLGEGSCFAQWVWATPSGTWPANPATPQCEESETWDGDATFTFVGRDHVSLYLGVTADVAYSFQRAAALGSIDSLARHGIPGTDATLGSDGEPPAGALTSGEIRRCESEFSQRLNGGLDFDPASEQISPDYRGTVITRKPGRWVYSRYYALTSYAGRGWEWECEMKVPVPKSVTGWDSLTVPWAVIRRKVPRAVDAFASPRRDVVVVTTPQELRVYRARGSTLGALLGNAAWESINPQRLVGGMEASYVAMSQWGTGNGAERWATSLSALLPRVAAVKR